MGGVRRSGRIEREIGIILLGTDTQGRLFSQETKTVVLSRHGTGIASTYRLALDEILALRLNGGGKEAGVRLVGPLGEERGGYAYGTSKRCPAASNSVAASRTFDGERATPESRGSSPGPALTVFFYDHA
jgi:hypothetical protein